MSLNKTEVDRFVELKNHTTIKIGRKAKYFFVVNSLSDLRKVLFKFSSFWYLLGNGSNLLVNDSVIERAVVKLGQKFNYIKRKDTFLEVGAATSLASVVNYCLRYNLSGLENLVGIPATIGGLLAVNASAYGRDISSDLVEVCLADTKGNIQKLKKEDLIFGYRSSSLEGKTILWARFSLSESKNLRQQLMRLFQHRLTSQDFNYPSCGCIFKNPSLKPAGLLIDSCGLKGFQKGDAQISFKHANFILNRGRARYRDVDYLITKIKSEVYKKYSIILEEEVKRWI